MHLKNAAEEVGSCNSSKHSLLVIVYNLDAYIGSARNYE